VFCVSLLPGLIKTVAGATIGGLLGLALFRTGKGYRSASIAAGVGVALGSTYERIVADNASTPFMVLSPSASTTSSRTNEPEGGGGGSE